MNPGSGRLLLLNIGTPSRLLSITDAGEDLRVLVADAGVAPDGLAIDAARRHIFWTLMGEQHQGEDFLAEDGAIERVSFDGSDRTVIVPPGGAFTPKQLVYDPQGDFLYWCDREGMRVMRSRPDGSDIAVLIQTGASDEDRRDRRRHCVGVAVDPTGGFIYWTQKGKPNGNEGRILRAPLGLAAGVDPAARADIETLFDGLPEPIDLEWDPDNSLLYWTDRGDPPSGNSLNRALIGPGSPLEIETLATGFREAIGLALDRGGRRAFVGDLAGDVHVISLDRPEGAALIFGGHGPMTGIAYLES